MEFSDKLLVFIANFICVFLFWTGILSFIHFIDSSGSLLKAVGAASVFAFSLKIFSCKQDKTNR
jgi:hypothetical protein